MVPQATRRRVVLVAGAAALFSGVALLGQLLAGIALPLGLGFSLILLVVAVVIIARIVDVDMRRRMLRVTATAAVIGFVATLAYDASRGVFARIDPSGFDPYGALPIFGSLLLGDSASEGAMWIAGIGFHVTNGITFAIAYGFLFGERARRSTRAAVVTGVVWGVFLETFQLTLYPGWLNIKTYAEFVTISFLGHVVYGLTLGLLAHRYLPSLDPRATEESPA
jgi:hypothetical protein